MAKWDTEIVKVVEEAERPLRGREIVERVLGCLPHSAATTVANARGAAVRRGLIATNGGTSPKTRRYMPIRRPSTSDDARVQAIRQRSDVPFGLDGDDARWLLDQLSAAEQELAALKGAAVPAPLDAQTELALREHLWLSHGHLGLYGDDGERQCSQCAPVWDYKRMPLADVIQQAIRARRNVNLEALKGVAVPEQAPLDVEAMRANLHATFNGGWTLHHADALRAFHHGMDTVCNVLAAHQRGARTNGIFPDPQP